MKQRYVCGFLFDYTDNYSVVLIEKNKPKWQEGKLNGVGGKVEDGETPLQAMAREFKEETGLEVKEDYWDNFVIWTGSDYVVYFYKSYNGNFKVYSATDEQVGKYNVNDLPANVIYNLRFLLPLALQNNIDWPVYIYEEGA